MRVDLKKDLPHLYRPATHDFVEVDVPPTDYLAVDGHGDPNRSPDYRTALELLYTAAYSARAALKSRTGDDFVVGPLEGLWTSADPGAFTSRHKDEWDWTMLIPLPDLVSEADVTEGLAAAVRKKPDLPWDRLGRRTLHEGRCLQVLHVGSFDDEGPTLARLHDEIMPARGLTFDGPHHEIYLSDARRWRRSGCARSCASRCAGSAERPEHDHRPARSSTPPWSRNPARTPSVTVVVPTLLPTPTLKGDLLAGLGALYADGSRIRQTLASAPDDVLEPDQSRREAGSCLDAWCARPGGRHRGHENLYPADAVLNLPVERHSHGLRRLAAVESSRGSCEQAGAAITRATGQRVGKRQVEALTARAAVDVADFYATRGHTEAAADDVLVISADGKGIVMRPDALRPATAKAAAKASRKLAARLSKGEKRNRKRLAEVGAVYDLEPVPREPSDIVGANRPGGNRPGNDPPDPPASRPEAVNKWVTASVVEDAAEVIADVFAEAERRDPHHRRVRVALVDGNNHQIQRIQTEANERGVAVTVVIDLVHFLEHLWRAAWFFFPVADPDAEAWLRQRALAILDGNAIQVAAGIRRRATAARLPKPERAKAN